MKPVYTLSIPAYKQNEKPDYGKIGKLIDDTLKEKFLHKNIAIRCLSLQDHPNKPIEELIQIIQTAGTDRYDPSRKMSVAHDFYMKKGVELFATPVKVSSDLSIMSEIIKDFYDGALKDRSYSLKVDLIVIYDLTQLELIPIQYEDGIGDDAYRFRDSEKRSDAVLGFVKIF